MLSKEVMPDYLHPNAKGYEIWAGAIEPKVKEMLGE
jgi:beta-glucosidase